MTCSRANFRAAGWGDADLEKPLVTVGSPWTNAMPCNNRIRELTDYVMTAIDNAGGKPVAAGTPVISDGLTQGSDAMKYSLVSRECVDGTRGTPHRRARCARCRAAAPAHRRAAAPLSLSGPHLPAGWRDADRRSLFGWNRPPRIAGILPTA